MSPNYPTPTLQAAAALAVPIVGKCVVCGKQVPGIPVPGYSHLMENECPRCGIKPFYLGHIAPYTGDTSRMTIKDAIEYVSDLDDPNMIEVCFRLEIMGHPPDGRREFLEFAYQRYWDVAMLIDPYPRAIILTLEECITDWKRDLKDPKLSRYYKALIRAE